MQIIPLHFAKDEKDTGLILAKNTDISTGRQGKAYVVCTECYDILDHNFAMNAPELIPSVVATNVAGECQEKYCQEAE